LFPLDAWKQRKGSSSERWGSTANRRSSFPLRCQRDTARFNWAVLWKTSKYLTKNGPLETFLRTEFTKIMRDRDNCSRTSCSLIHQKSHCSQAESPPGPAGASMTEPILPGGPGLEASWGSLNNPEPSLHSPSTRAGAPSTEK
jgi:hypothetical protein